MANRSEGQLMDSFLLNISKNLFSRYTLLPIATQCWCRRLFRLNSSVPRLGNGITIKPAQFTGHGMTGTQTSCPNSCDSWIANVPEKPTVVRTIKPRIHIPCIYLFIYSNTYCLGHTVHSGSHRLDEEYTHLKRRLSYFCCYSRIL